MAGYEFPQPYKASARLGMETYRLAVGMPIEGVDWTLHKVGLLEDHLARYSLEPEVTDVAQRQQIMRELNTGLSLYHGALPFSEAERRWISGICMAVETAPEHHMLVGKVGQSIDILRSSEATIVSGGVFKVVNGDALYQRWRSWCGGEGEFESMGMASVGIAHRGLQRVTALLKPGMF